MLHCQRNPALPTGTTLSPGCRFCASWIPEADPHALRRIVEANAGAVESASEHPVARAVAGAALSELGVLPTVTGFRNEPGVGVTGVVDGHQVSVGRNDGRIEVAWDGIARAKLVVRDVVKPESAAAIAELKQLGLTRRGREDARGRSASVATASVPSRAELRRRKSRRALPANRA